MACPWHHETLRACRMNPHAKTNPTCTHTITKASLLWTMSSSTTPTTFTSSALHPNFWTRIHVIYHPHQSYSTCHNHLIILEKLMVWIFIDPMFFCSYSMLSCQYFKYDNYIWSLSYALYSHSYSTLIFPPMNPSV